MCIHHKKRKQQQISKLLEWLETNSRHGAPEVVLEPVLLARERGRRLLRRGRLHLLDVRLHDHVLGQRGQRRRLVATLPSLLRDQPVVSLRRGQRARYSAGT